MQLRFFRKMLQMSTAFSFAAMIITGHTLWLAIITLILASITLGISIKELKG